MKEVEKSLDSQLWHACAGGMVQMPAVNSKVYYFPQGHAEHCQSTVDFTSSVRIPPFILSRVSAVKFLADPETDEVYAKIRLIPVGRNESEFDDDGALPSYGSDNSDKPVSFAKTLTQSDANNGGGFSVPRYCAETIFPRLDYTADPPVQTVVAKDVHGEVWKFRHIYRGTPRRHLLTTGWSSFVNQKKLVAGDSIVFLRGENGDLCVGIRRAKRGIGGGQECSSGWNSGPSFGGYSGFLRDDDCSKLIRNGYGGNLNSDSGLSSNLNSNCGVQGRGRIQPESVVEAANLAANGQAFEVVYYPRASTPEFCVWASSVRAATRVQWFTGMRFKMAFETEDSSRISWFMGTIASVQVADPIRWPKSPWRLLQVTWDEPDLLQNVKRVSPWLVELVSNMPMIQLSPFSQPRKKLRLPHQHPDFSLDTHVPMPSFLSNPLGPSSPMCCLSDNTPAGIQGARHAQYRTYLSDLHLSNKLQSGIFPSSFQHFNFDSHSRTSDGIMNSQMSSKENVSCLLTMGNSNSIQNLEKSDNRKKHQFLLFGQPILTEEQISSSCSSDTDSHIHTGKCSSDGSVCALEQQVPGFLWHKDFKSAELGLETGHCKVFMESEDVGRTLDLSVLDSYEELYRKLASMFGIERTEMLSRVLYRDTSGTVKQIGDESFSDFTKTAQRITILMHRGSNNVGRILITGMLKAGKGLSSSKTGSLSISA